MAGAELDHLSLLRVFGHLDATALGSVALTSRSFRDIVDEVYLGLLPQPLRHVVVNQTSPVRARALFNTLYNTNLLHNPWFDPELNQQQHNWIVVNGGLGSGWSWEGDHACGVSDCGVNLPMPLPPRPPFLEAGPVWRQAGCVAASYAWGEVYQVVDLVDELQQRGLTQRDAIAFLDSCPALTCEVFVTARFDCGSLFKVSVILDSQPVDAAVAHNARGARVWKTNVQELHAVPQWQQQVVQVEGYHLGKRRAVVVFRSKDTRFWAGHYGTKFSAPVLHFSRPQLAASAEAVPA